MNYRMAKIFAQKSYTDDFSELIDIRLSNPISRIRIGYEGLNTVIAADNWTTAHWAKSIKKIELADGSDILFSLSGEEAYGAQFFQNKVEPSDWLHSLQASYFHVSLFLDFGRHLWDTLLALDPTKFKNLQLKIENDEDAGGSAPSASKMEVDAWIFDEKTITPMGFLQTKRIKQYTMGDASHEYTELPLDHNIRKIMIRALKAGTELCQVLGNIKLSEDFDKSIIVDEDPATIVRLFADENRPYRELITTSVDGNSRIQHCTPSDRGAAIAVPWRATLDGYVACYGVVGQQFKIIGSSGSNVQALVQGYCPMSMVSIPMGDDQDPDDWFSPGALKSLRLDMLSAASMTNTAEIIVQQHRPY